MLAGSAAISRYPNADTGVLVARRLAGAQTAQFDCWWTFGQAAKSNIQIGSASGPMSLLLAQIAPTAIPKLA